MKLQKRFMKLAITRAKEGIKKGENPFGACIVKDNKIVSCTYDKVFIDNDMSSHAEMLAIRETCRALSSCDLSACILYSTCEPCPMCFTFAHLVKIPEIVFGISIKDGRKLGYLRDTFSTKKMKNWLNSPINLHSGFLRKEALELIKIWEKKRLINNTLWANLN